MAQAMTPDEVRTFLSHGQRTGKVATMRADGRPHIAPIWFVLDGDDIVFMTGAGTVKGKALSRDPRLSMSVDLEQPPYAFVIVDGVATLSDDLDAMLPWSIAIAERYVPAADADAFGRRNAVAGELLVRVSPTKILAFNDVMG